LITFLKDGKLELYPNIDKEATGQNIKLLREDNGISVKELAKILKLESVQGVYNWQYGKSLPVLEHLLILSDLFGKPIRELLVFKSAN
jgi:transcriptional regulator with XRE-family HTH domain